MCDQDVGEACSMQMMDELGTCKKRGLMIQKKWIAEHEKELTKTVWLNYDRLDRDHVAVLKCEVCIEFGDQLICMRNFNRAFITGSTNFRESTVLGPCIICIAPNNYAAVSKEWVRISH